MAGLSAATLAIPAKSNSNQLGFITGTIMTFLPEGARRRVSLTFRPGEGLLLTGLDGRVEEIEPNFDLNV